MFYMVLGNNNPKPEDEDARFPLSHVNIAPLCISTRILSRNSFVVSLVHHQLACGIVGAKYSRYCNTYVYLNLKCGKLFSLLTFPSPSFSLGIAKLHFAVVLHYNNKHNMLITYPTEHFTIEFLFFTRQQFYTRADTERD